jgi:hypothetical protein
LTSPTSSIGLQIDHSERSARHPNFFPAPLAAEIITEKTGIIVGSIDDDKKKIKDKPEIPVRKECQPEP